MRTLTKNTFRAVRREAAIHGISVQDGDLPFRRGGQGRSYRASRLGLRRGDGRIVVPLRARLWESYPTPPQPENPHPADDDDFPFSALLRLVRSMRE